MSLFPPAKSRTSSLRWEGQEELDEVSSAQLSGYLGKLGSRAQLAVPVSRCGRKGLEGCVVESGLGPGLLVDSPLYVSG